MVRLDLFLHMVMDFGRFAMKEARCRHHSLQEGEGRGGLCLTYPRQYYHGNDQLILSRLDILADRVPDRFGI